MNTETTAPRKPPPLYRASINWERLYREGLRVPLGAETGEASVFLVPFDGERDLVVALVPCRRMIGGTAHAMGAHLIGLARHVREVLGWVGLGRMLT